MLKCVIFDRDGVLIKDYGYVHSISKTKWLKGSIEAIKFLNKKKILIIIITNQSGIARGIFRIKELKNFHRNLIKNLTDKKAQITDIFYCPYHPQALIKKYKKKTNLRKPGNGMILKALKKYKLNPDECIMIGDKRSDMLAAKKSNIEFEYKLTKPLDMQVKKFFNRINNIKK